MANPGALGQPSSALRFPEDPLVPNRQDTPEPQTPAGSGPPDPQGQQRPGSQDQEPAGSALIEQLARESRQFDGTGADPERNCWLVVHRHHHGVLPSEYDIREIPEDLYLAVLAARRASEPG